MVEQDIPTDNCKTISCGNLFARLDNKQYYLSVKMFYGLLKKVKCNCVLQDNQIVEMAARFDL